MATFFLRNARNFRQKQPVRVKHALLLTVALAVWIVQPLQAAQWFSAKSRAEGDTFYRSAFAAYEAGDYPRAHGLLDQAEKLKPDQADGWNLRGAVFLKQGAYGRAEAAFNRAAKLDPNLWAARFNQAEAAFKGKNYPVARSRFDQLVSQTNRFKEKNQWELAQYKAFLSSLLMNDGAGAQKRLAKLPAVGGVTPAVAYAQAATAYHRNDLAGAQKMLATAQTTYSPSLNNLFSDSLATLGWQQAAPAAVPMTGGALAAAGSMLPEPRPPVYVIDPRIEAAAAEPLPMGDSGVGNARRQNAAPQMLAPINASPSDALLQQAAAGKSPPVPVTGQDSALERGALLD